MVRPNTSDTPNINNSANQPHFIGEIKQEQVQENGRTYKAQTSYKPGTQIKHGQETFYYLEGGIYHTAMYDNGKLVGLYQMFSPKGVLIYEAHYQNGLLHGLCRIFDVQNGELRSEMNFAYGVQEGIMNVYDQNGKLWYELHYQKGKKQGTAKEFDNNGKIISQTFYNNDKEVK